MPTYSYKNKDTEEYSQIYMTISEMEEFEKTNPNMERVFHTLNVVDSVGIGVTKPPSDFQKYVLGRVKESVPGASAIGNKRWGIPREV